MSVQLGPMPEEARDYVRQLIHDGRDSRVESFHAGLGLLLSCGPGGTSYLDEDGELWDWWHDEDSPWIINEERRRLLLAVIATKIWPQLACWLPTRTQTAQDCPGCRGAGVVWSNAVFTAHCQECCGLGWWT